MGNLLRRILLAMFTLDVWISFVVAKPIAVWMRDRLGINKWDLARELLNGGLLASLALVIKTYVDRGFHWTAIFPLGGWCYIWWTQMRSIRDLRENQVGWVLALVHDSFLRLWFLVFTAGCIVGVRNLMDLSTILAFTLILMGLYIKTVNMPPPPPPREDERLVPAFS